MFVFSIGPLFVHASHLQNVCVCGRVCIGPTPTEPAFPYLFFADFCSVIHSKGTFSVMYSTLIEAAYFNSHMSTHFLIFFSSPLLSFVLQLVSHIEYTRKFCLHSKPVVHRNCVWRKVRLSRCFVSNRAHGGGVVLNTTQY